VILAENSGIEWTTHTFNPWIGCTKVSPACDHCYAEAYDKRYSGGIHWGAKAARRRTGTDNWRKPLRWNKQAALDGVRPRVFCASLADVFDNAVPAEWRADLWKLIRDTPNLDWLLLTKRPQNIAKMLPDDWGSGYANVWLGTTVENQTEADRRIPHLLSVSAAVKFLSCEPLLGRVDLSGYLHGLSWAITGGESGPEFRHAEPDWFRLMRDQCAAANVPFLFKQWEGKDSWEPLSITSKDYTSRKRMQEMMYKAAREAGYIL
jgi:protein gp37